MVKFSKGSAADICGHLGFYLKFQISFALSSASSFCCSGDCLDELPFVVRFLLKDRMGGQPTTGGIAPLHQIRALVSVGFIRLFLERPGEFLY
uniref:Uncharacterized protein n=1 Tax=Oryza brachyantha TaxID=4533 RepID=J3M909_ORYBR